VAGTRLIDSDGRVCCGGRSLGGACSGGGPVGTTGRFPPKAICFSGNCRRPSAALGVTSTEDASVTELESVRGGGVPPERLIDGEESSSDTTSSPLLAPESQRMMFLPLVGPRFMVPHQVARGRWDEGARSSYDTAIYFKWSPHNQ
jgi:hypothetical protein